MLAPPFRHRRTAGRRRVTPCGLAGVLAASLVLAGAVACTPDGTTTQGTTTQGTTTQTSSTPDPSPSAHDPHPAEDGGLVGDRGNPSTPRPATPADSPSAAAPTVPGPTPSADRGPALESATWGEREGGRSLAVVPAPWVRASPDPAALGQLWAELVAAEPEADSTVMHDQLLCHAVGAPDKDSWNLEPWRPDVGLAAVMQARCNPTT